MSFASSQLQRLSTLWDQMLNHPFLLQTRDGTIPENTFANWMQQDYLFVEAATTMMAVLIARAPYEHRKPLVDALDGLYAELDLFRERAASAGVDLLAHPPSFICHAYAQFLVATAYQASYAETFAVLYAAEKAYHESWKVVKSELDPQSRWYPFVENWAGDAFAGYVQFLERELDLLADAAGPEEKGRMAALFEYTVKYEIAFWEMALTGSTWPGLETLQESPTADLSNPRPGKNH